VDEENDSCFIDGIQEVRQIETTGVRQSLGQFCRECRTDTNIDCVEYTVSLLYQSVNERLSIGHLSVVCWDFGSEFVVTVVCQLVLRKGANTCVNDLYEMKLRLLCRWCISVLCVVLLFAALQYSVIAVGPQ
jgi:hypothetical protein